MTAEDVDLDISIAFDKLALTPHNIYAYLLNSRTSNIDKKSIQTLIDNLI